MLNALKVAAVLSAVAALSFSLTGCGCDEEKLSNCAVGTDKPGGSCVDLEQYTFCIKDNGCCEHEKSGKTMKAQIDEMIHGGNGLPTPSKYNGCKNPCQDGGDPRD